MLLGRLARQPLRNATVQHDLAARPTQLHIDLGTAADPRHCSRAVKPNKLCPSLGSQPSPSLKGTLWRGVAENKWVLQGERQPFR